MSPLGGGAEDPFLDGCYPPSPEQKLGRENTVWILVTTHLPGQGAFVECRKRPPLLLSPGESGAISKSGDFMSLDLRFLKVARTLRLGPGDQGGCLPLVTT